jgi:hypothetical protein
VSFPFLRKGKNKFVGQEKINNDNNNNFRVSISANSSEIKRISGGNADNLQLPEIDDPAMKARLNLEKADKRKRTKKAKQAEDKGIGR